MKTFKVFALAIVTVVVSCKKTASTVKPPVATITISGKTYPTAVIGTQTWTTVNYDGVGGIADSALDEAVYGKFYGLNELSSINLPSGWRVPTQTDFQRLMASQGPLISLVKGDDAVGMGLDSSASSHLISNSNWAFTGDDKSAFNAQPAGIYAISESLFEYKATANFLSSTPDGEPNNGNFVFVIEAFSIFPNGGNVFDAYLGGYATTDYKFSLRFVKDN